MQVEYLKLHIEDLTGISLDVITVGLAALVLILIIIMIVNGVKMKKLKKKYEAFMAGKNAASLEDTLIKRLNQVEDLIASDEHTQEKVQMVSGVSFFVLFFLVVVLFSLTIVESLL